MSNNINSNSLYKENQDLYKTFFVNYPLIVSAPGGVILSGAFSHQFGGLGLHHKIPLRNYVGIKLNQSNLVKINHFGTFDIFQNKFVQDIVLDGLSEKINFLKEKLKYFNKDETGIEIGILNEIPRRHGLNNPGVNAVNFAIIYLLITDQITKDELKSFQQDSNSISTKKADLIKKTTKEFHEEWIGPNNSGFGAFACLIESSSPIVYQSNGSPITRSLDEIFDFKLKEEFPCDIVVIGTSDRNNIDFQLEQYDKISDKFSLDHESIKKLMDIGFSLEGLENINYDDLVIKQYQKAIDATAIASIVLMGKYLNTQNKENQKRFFDILNNSYSSLSLVDKNFSRKTKTLTYVQDFFYSELPDIPYSLTTSIANHIVIFITKDHFREQLVKLQLHLQKKLGFDVSYPYISWRDGFEKNGVKIEQWNSENINSSFVPEGTLYIEEFEPMSTVRHINYLGSADKLENKLDILFDMDEKKVFIKGEKITSKDLPSTHALIILINALFENDNMIIGNKELPDLSYFQDRNEIQSKIISPLKIVIERYLNKNLNLKATGGITDFKIKLMPSDISMGLIKRK